MGLGVMVKIGAGNLIGGGWGYWGVVRGKTRVLADDWLRVFLG